MASLDSLPPDQRAVLQLVLERGRSYDEIAQMLSIDRAAVRERALNAFDALGPSTRVPAEQRALITDYLLGQLPEKVADDTHRGLAESANERAWARVVASELGTLAAGPLPEIPTDGADAPAAAPVAARPEAAIAEPATAAGGPESPAPEPAEPTPAEPTPAEPVSAESAAAASGAASPRSGRRRFGRGSSADGASPQRSGHPVSRRDGAILLGGGAAVIVAVIVAIILITGGSSNKTTTTRAASTPASTATAAQTTSTQSAATTATIKPLAQVTLTSPQAGSKTKGVAIVVRQGTTTAIELAAQAVPANTSHDAYAVWLYNSPTDASLLGFVNPGVKANGVLRTLGRLPANANHFTQLLVTRETQAKPHAPGAILLQGALSLPAA